ncbi:MAG TPA: recombinase family protein [Fimbriimonadaceae bacterium]
MRTLIERIKVDMVKSVNERGCLLTKRRAEIEERKRERDIPPLDVHAWRQQFETLSKEKGVPLNVGYWRVSTVKQVSGEGPDTQVKDIIGYAIAQAGHNIDLWCYDVDSGKEETRVGLDFLVEMMGSGKVDSIIAQRLDRFARNNYLAETLQRAARKDQVRLISATEHIPDGAAGTMLRQILQAFAQYELALLTARLSGGKRVRKEREGTWGGGEVPYGYWSIGDGRLVICAPEERIVELIYFLYGLGYSQASIGQALNRWGIPTRKRGKHGWAQSHIRRILMNEAKYRAEAPFSKTVLNPRKIAHPPLLPHREDPLDRTYLFGKVKRILRATIPDSLYLTSPDPIRPHNGYQYKMTREQAVSLQTLYSLRDNGLTLKQIQEELNRLGLKAPSGGPWSWSNVQNHCERRVLYQDAVAVTGVTPASVEHYVSPASAERHALDLILDLRAAGHSYPRIKEKLNEEGLKTAKGAEWSLSSIYRAVKGKKRRTQRYRAALAERKP